MTSADRGAPRISSRPLWHSQRSYLYSVICNDHPDLHFTPVDVVNATRLVSSSEVMCVHIAPVVLACAARPENPKNKHASHGEIVLTESALMSRGTNGISGERG